MKENKVTRVEIIDWTEDDKFGGGRAFVCWKDDVDVNPVLQDDDRTLKVFLTTKGSTRGKDLYEREQ